MLIDFHTHIFPDKIAGKTLEVLKAGILKYEHTPAEAYYDGTKETMLLGKSGRYSGLFTLTWIKRART